MRNKDRASKQKRERQGWNKAQMRAAKARMCVLCRRIAAKEDMFRIYKTIDSDGSPDFHLDRRASGRSYSSSTSTSTSTSSMFANAFDNRMPENNLESNGHDTGTRLSRSAYLCQDAACITEACKRQRLTRALRLSPRVKASKEKSLIVMQQMLSLLSPDAE